MKIFPWQKQKEFFTSEERNQIVEAIRNAELRTSGEVRVFIESRCKYVDAIDRAVEVFFELGMERTDDRNGTIVYVAVKDKQAAVFGDQGIYQKLGQKYWEDEVNKMMVCFKQSNLAEGIVQCVSDIGEALYQNFPYDHKTDKNELPDDIVFGR
jgi:uncharacterized membrane protein